MTDIEAKLLTTVAILIVLAAIGIVAEVMRLIRGNT